MMDINEVIVSGITGREEAIFEWFKLTSHMAEEPVTQAIEEANDAFVFVVAVAFEAGRYFEEMEPDMFETDRFLQVQRWVNENAPFATDQFETMVEVARENSHTELGELIGYLVSCSFEAGRMFEGQNPNHPKGVNAY